MTVWIAKSVFIHRNVWYFRRTKSPTRKEANFLSFQTSSGTTNLLIATFKAGGKQVALKINRIENRDISFPQAISATFGKLEIRQRKKVHFNVTVSSSTKKTLLIKILMREDKPKTMDDYDIEYQHPWNLIDYLGHFGQTKLQREKNNRCFFWVVFLFARKRFWFKPSLDEWIICCDEKWIWR